MTHKPFQDQQSLCGQSVFSKSNLPPLAAATILRNPDEMMAFGAALAAAVVPPRVIALSGDLGAGKTTLAKGMISALTGVLPSEVTSPTFQYMHLYRFQTKPEKLLVAHFDTWRLHGVEEFIELGLDEYLFNSLAIVEWPDRIRQLLPESTLWISVSIIDDGRLVTINPPIRT